MPRLVLTVLVVATLLWCIGLACCSDVCLLDLGAYSDSACSVFPKDSTIITPELWKIFRLILVESGKCSKVAAGLLTVRVDCRTKSVEMFDIQYGGPNLCNRTANWVSHDGQCTNITASNFSSYLKINYLSPTVISGAGACTFFLTPYDSNETCSSSMDRTGPNAPFTHYDQSCWNLTTSDGGPNSVWFDCKNQTLTRYSKTDKCGEDAVGLVFRAGECTYDDFRSRWVFTSILEGTAGAGSRLTSWAPIGFNVLDILNQARESLEKATASYLYTW